MATKVLGKVVPKKGVDYFTSEDIKSLNIPTKTSELINDSLFASESYVKNEIANAQLGGEGGEIDLSGYATKDDLFSKVDKVIGKSLIADNEIERLANVTNYNDTEIKNTLKNKADTSAIPTKVSQLSNDKGYLTEIPSEYVTETELSAKGYLKSVPSEYITETELNNKGYLTEHQDLTEYAKTTDIPTKVSELSNDKNYLTSIPSEYITETELNAKGYLTEHQDISHLATKDEIANQILVLTDAELEALSQEELASKYANGTRLIMISETENLVPTAIGSNGAIYNGCGYMNGYRLSSSGSITATDSAVVTGYIPYTYGKKIEIIGGLNTSNQGGQYIATYNDAFELIGVNYLETLIGNSGGTSVCNKKNVYIHTIKTSSFASTENINMFKTAKYIRVSINPCIGKELIVREV